MTKHPWLITFRPRFDQRRIKEDNHIYKWIKTKINPSLIQLNRPFTQKREGRRRINPAKLFQTLYVVELFKFLSFFGTAERGWHAGMSRSCGLPFPYQFVPNVQKKKPPFNFCILKSSTTTYNRWMRNMWIDRLVWL